MASRLRDREIGWEMNTFQVFQLIVGIIFVFLGINDIIASLK